MEYLILILAVTALIGMFLYSFDKKTPEVAPPTQRQKKSIVKGVEFSSGLAESPVVQKSDPLLVAISSLRDETIKNREELEKIKWACRGVGFILFLIGLGIFTG